MNRGHLSLCIVLLATLFPARAQTQSETIVPPSDQISDYDARQDLAQVFRRLGKIAEAENELHQLLRIRPNDPVLLADLADLAADRGHFARSRSLYEQALSKADRASSHQLRLRYALQARAWGDFYLAEKVLRAHLKENPEDVSAALDLAGVLAAEEQYAAAGAQYSLLTRAPRARPQALVGLATSCLTTEDFRNVLPYADLVLKSLSASQERPAAAGSEESNFQYPTTPSLHHPGRTESSARTSTSTKLLGNPNQIRALTLRGEALLRLKRYDDAKRDFGLLTTLPMGRLSGWIGLGQIARAQKDEPAAQTYFRRAAESDPKNIRARYLLAGKQVNDPRFAQEIAGPIGLTAAELSTLAELYSSDKLWGQAIATYQAALQKDPDYFPAQIGLVQTLAYAHRYKESLELLTRLQGEFPNNAKIMLTLARVLSWSRRYDESMRTYRQLNALNPADTVPGKEMAQVATWSNK